MDGLKSRSHVIVMGATNRPIVLMQLLEDLEDLIVKLILEFLILLEDYKFFEFHTKNMKLADDVNLQAVASESHGHVGADLAALCTEAALQCIREKSGYSLILKMKQSLLKSCFYGSYYGSF